MSDGMTVVVAFVLFGGCLAAGGALIDWIISAFKRWFA